MAASLRSGRPGSGDGRRWRSRARRGAPRRQRPTRLCLRAGTNTTGEPGRPSAPRTLWSGRPLGTCRLRRHREGQPRPRPPMRVEQSQVSASTGAASTREELPAVGRSPKRLLPVKQNSSCSLDNATSRPVSQAITLAAGASRQGRVDALRRRTVFGTRQADVVHVGGSAGSTCVAARRTPEAMWLHDGLTTSGTSAGAAWHGRPDWWSR